VPKPHRGRPLKFGRPARSVTVTLPQDTIAQLKAIDPDLGQAIVRVSARTDPGRVARRPRVALVTQAGRSVIVVTPVPALKRLRGIQLIPTGDAERALIALTEPMGVAQFELRIQDALETVRLSDDDRQTLQQLEEILKETRRSGATLLKELRIIVLETVRRRKERLPAGR